MEPTVGEKLCRLWASVPADSKGGGSGDGSSSSWRSSHRDHSHSVPHTAFPPHMSPYVHPRFPVAVPGLFDSRASIHMNPAALYALPRYGSAPPLYWAATPPPTRTVPSSTKRYSSRHKSTSRPPAEQNTTTTESQQ